MFISRFRIVAKDQIQYNKRGELELSQQHIRRFYSGFKKEPVVE
jgi:hypothetical protein